MKYAILIGLAILLLVPASCTNMTETTTGTVPTQTTLYVTLTAPASPWPDVPSYIDVVDLIINVYVDENFAVGLETSGKKSWNMEYDATMLSLLETRLAAAASGGNVTWFLVRAVQPGGTDLRFIVQTDNGTPKTSRIVPVYIRGEVIRERAVEVASRGLEPSIVERADISAEKHGWYWEVIFDNLDATYDELSPYPLRQGPTPPPGTTFTTPAGTWRYVRITVNAQRGTQRSGGAGREPAGGPYITEEQAREAAAAMLQDSNTDTTWFNGAQSDIYRRFDTWYVLYWEDSDDGRCLEATVDAVTGQGSGISYSSGR